MICSFLRANRTFALSLSKNERLARKSSLFSPWLWQFFTAFPIYMPKSKSLPSLFALLLFTKERPWAIRSRQSLQKSDGSESQLVKSKTLFRLQKTSDSHENQRANSQPWPLLLNFETFLICSSLTGQYCINRE